MSAPLGGRYVLEGHLADGGMGEVFRASAMGADGFKKPVVVKRIRAVHVGRPELLSMFVDEAKLMTRLAHPNIVQVLDFGRGEDGSYFLVLELVDGVDFGKLLAFLAAQGESISFPLAVHIVAQAVRGLGFAHTQGAPRGEMLVHRDVSPGNVLLSRVGEVKVADFGVALVGSGERSEQAAFVGKPSYMSPEQFAVEDVDGRADLFSAGVMLFQALTGAWPFDGATYVERQAAAKLGHVRSARSLRPALPPAVDELFARALAPVAGDRYPDARAMVQALTAVALSEGAAATQDDVADAAARVLAGSPAKKEIVLGFKKVTAELADATRVDRGGGSGAFTVSLSDALVRPESPGRTGRADDDAPSRASTPSPEQTGSGTQGPMSLAMRGSPPEPRPKRMLVFGIVALVAAGVGLPLLLSSFASPDRTARGAPEPSAPSSFTPSVSVSVEDASPAGSVALVPSAGATASGHWPPAGKPAPTGVGPPPAPSVPAIACTGSVVIKASHAWVVTGGPTPVEAPVRVSWPCGTYALNAVSRVQGADRRSQSVTVTQGGVSGIDLR